uniref:Uncharacterized protein n=1 Tax=Anguilla anguilla TaxID=7936 RepID=A0A0E9W6X7_ANGAN
MVEVVVTISSFPHVNFNDNGLPIAGVSWPGPLHCH